MADSAAVQGCRVEGMGIGGNVKDEEETMQDEKRARSSRTETGLSAIGSIINLFPVLEITKRRRRSQADDQDAIAGDWKRVGEGIRRAMGQLDEELRWPPK